ncbi:MAG TPA: hypothetical protein VF444_05290 [Pseudonocardiaceae bacterium]
MNPTVDDGSRRINDQSRTRTTLVDQHATWIAVNPIQGCPKGCLYCFLHDRGQAPARPEHLANPAETVDLLLESAYYAPDRTVALYTWTDVMALPSSRAHLTELLSLLVERRIPNPIVLITKCPIPDDVINTLAAARRGRLQTIVYLSYSGLGRDVERGVGHRELRQNFPRLAEADVPVVHYWRPSFPESATASVMEAVFDWAASYACCTMAAGLKVEQVALPRLARLWPELASTPGVATAECVYPRAFWDFIHATGQRRPDYPLFHTNSCALAYVLGRADRFGVFGGDVCRLRNHCPAAQRRHCETEIAVRPVVTESAVRIALDRRGHTGVSFTLDHARREVRIDAGLPTSTIGALTQDLGLRVRAGRRDTDPYWSSGTTGALPLIIGDVA